jgi:hypothetical protein
VHAVDTRPRPVDLSGCAEDVERRLVQGGHHTEADPFGEPAFPANSASPAAFRL